MIPPFDDDDDLPPGIPTTSWEEFDSASVGLSTQIIGELRVYPYLLGSDD